MLVFATEVSDLLWWPYAEGDKQKHKACKCCEGGPQNFHMNPEFQKGTFKMAELGAGRCRGTLQREIVRGTSLSSLVKCKTTLVKSKKEGKYLENI